MPSIIINGVSVNVPENATLLQAAALAGVDIPTLCHMEGRRPNTSCMICVVEDAASGRLLPACSARVVAGMRIETDSEAVTLSRRAVLELMVSEHQGDCTGPCERACPAGLNIPLMLRCLERGDVDAACALALEELVLPGILGSVCTAPCEAGCRRGQYDEPIAIRRAHGYLAELDPVELPRTTASPGATGKKVAVLGSGPAGLAAAYRVALQGHGCRIYEKKPVPGGMLNQYTEAELPSQILKRDLDRIAAAGVEFVCNREAENNLDVEYLCQAFDAVIVTDGSTLPEGKAVFSAEEKRLPVRSVASGKAAAHGLQAFFDGKTPADAPFYDSIIGRISKEQAEVYVQGRIGQSGLARGRTVESPREEAARCLHCDCHAPISCKLRLYAAKYDVRKGYFRGTEKMPPNGLLRFGNVIFDVGKCIKCGLCVSITQSSGKDAGLSFRGRGYFMEVGVPFNESLELALAKSSQECVSACPTGALAFEDKEERFPGHGGDAGNCAS